MSNADAAGTTLEYPPQPKNVRSVWRLTTVSPRDTVSFNVCREIKPTWKSRFQFIFITLLERVIILYIQLRHWLRFTSEIGKTSLYSLLRSSNLYHRTNDCKLSNSRTVDYERHLSYARWPSEAREVSKCNVFSQCIRFPCVIIRLLGSKLIEIYLLLPLLVYGIAIFPFLIKPSWLTPVLE